MDGLNPVVTRGGWQVYTDEIFRILELRGANKKMKFPGFRQTSAISSKFHLWFLICVNILVMSCGTTSTTTVSRRQAEEPRGFFGNMMDQITERECNVGRFICPYGLGPAGEPCTCTDPSGIVLSGRTVK